MKHYKNMSIEEIIEYRLGLLCKIRENEIKLNKLKSDLEYNTEITIRVLADHIRRMNEN